MCCPRAKSLVVLTSLFTRINQILLLFKHRINPLHFYNQQCFFCEDGDHLVNLVQSCS